MKTRLIRIGNSRGIRLPKSLIEEVGLSEEVELRVHQGGILITPIEATCTGWAEAAEQLHQREEDQLLDPPTATRFDEEEWK